MANYIKGTYKQKNPYTAHETDFTEFFSTALEATMTSMSLTAKERAFSAKRKKIGEVAEKVLSEKDLFDKVCAHLYPHFSIAFKKAGEKTSSMNEALYTEFYNITVKKELCLHLQKLTQGNRVFVGVLLHELMEHLIVNLSKLLETTKEAHDISMTETELSVLYYISGYIVSAIKKKAKRGSSHPKQKALLESMEKSIASGTREDSLNKYSLWLDKVNRGGLTIPSDSFYELVKEMEMCSRPVSIANHTGIDRLQLRESILDNITVRYYANLLFKGPFEFYIVDAITNLFLTLRGHAWAQLLKKDFDHTDKKALRKSLMSVSKR